MPSEGDIQTMATLSYAIIGTGAIGGFYGARLQQAGCDVHFLLRSDYGHVRQSGLKVDSIEGDFALPQVKAYRDPAALPPVDVAIVALKTTRNHQLCELLPQIKPGGAILSLQNGFGVEGANAQQITEKNLPIPAILMARWQKQVWKVPFNGLSDDLEATTEAMIADEGVRSLITNLMQEVVTLANAWGKRHSPSFPRQLSGDIITKMQTHTETMPPYRTSMKIDFDESRPLEIETILGNPIREANKLAVPVPNMQMLYQQLSFLMSGNCSK